jgi:hypothetical protein
MSGHATELYGDDRAAIGGGGVARASEEKDTNEVPAPPTFYFANSERRQRLVFGEEKREPTWENE